MCLKYKLQIACFMVLFATYIEKIMHNIICVTGAHSREIITFFISQVSGLVKNFNTRVYAHTINVIEIKLCMMELLIELYLFI